MPKIENQLKDRLLAMQRSQYVIPPPGKSQGFNIPARWDGVNFFWSGRILAISTGRGKHFGSDGFYNLEMPTGGQIPGYGGAAGVNCSVNGIQMVSHTQLWAILPVNGPSILNQAATQYAVTGYTSDFVVPDNWFWVAGHTENTLAGGMIKTCWGDTLDYWRTLTYSNSYIDYGGGFAHRIKLSANGTMVTMRGLITLPVSFSVGVAAFTVPVGYRPANQLILPGVSNDSPGTWRIGSDGIAAIYSAPGGAGSWFSVSSSWAAEL